MPNRHSRCMHSSHKSVSEHWLSEEENQTDRQTDRGTVESKKDDNTTSMPMHPLFCLKTGRILLTWNNQQFWSEIPFDCPDCWISDQV
jgi:hypothetical protein